MRSRKVWVWSILALTAIVLLYGLGASGAISLLDRDDWRFFATGFIETDVINDSTRSFNEVIGNSPVALGTGKNADSGTNGQTQFSGRNTRFAFGVKAPKYHGWKSLGYWEMDFMGYNPSAGTSNSETGFYTSPTARVRQAFLEASTSRFSLKAGQTWDILGFQPYYFMASAYVTPLPGTLFNRTIELRTQYNFHLGDSNQLQMVGGVLRPPQAGAETPDLQAGIRWVLGSLRSGFTGATMVGRSLQPMSLAISGAIRRFSVPGSLSDPDVEDKFVAGAFAADTLIPLIYSWDNRDVGNTLTLVGEYSMGSGYGDQLPHWTGNLPSNLRDASTGATKTIESTHPFDLDSGIGDYNNAGDFELLKLRSYDVQLQYNFASPYWIGLGYSEIYSSNLIDVTTNGLTSSGNLGYDREDALFANIFHNFTPRLRAALEYAYVNTYYVDGTKAANNRFQASIWFIF